jgi:hypothetical protein
MPNPQLVTLLAMIFRKELNLWFLNTGFLSKFSRKILDDE